MTVTLLPHYRRIRSFVRRDSRQTLAQARAYEQLMPSLGFTKQSEHFTNLFTRQAPRFLEIGFGYGQSLLALAKAHPDLDFLGVETHKPGIGALLMGVAAENLANLRIHHGDAVELLESMIPDASLSGIQIFFPDPWQKRRHHPRRLIQSDFVRLLVAKCEPGASLHLATDWQDYAKHMLIVLEAEQQLANQAGKNQFAEERSPYRPIVTKFEQRAIQQGRSVWELQFTKI